MAYRISSVHQLRAGETAIRFHKHQPLVLVYVLLGLLCFVLHFNHVLNHKAKENLVQ